MLKAIDRRTHNEYAIQASFHGIKIPMRDNVDLLHKQAVAAFDPKEQAAIDAAFEETKARKMRTRKHG